jgi:trafficking protein particle complex subunit 11
MGEEYYCAKDYSRALALLSRVTWEYRHERWWSLLTSVLVTQLKCSYLIASLAEYIMACLELVSEYAENSQDDKKRIYSNLLQVLSGQQPDPEPGSFSDAASAAWNNTLTANDVDPLTIEMSNVASFIDCKALFSSESFTADKPVVVEVYLRSTGPASVTFSKLYVTFNNPLYNNLCSSSCDVTIESGQVKKYKFSFVGHTDDIGKVIEIKSVCLEWSGGLRRCVCLHWIGPGGSAILPVQRAISGKKHNNTLAWDEIIVRPVTRLLFRDSSALDIDVKHSPPGLVNEMYHYAVTITNNETSSISDVTITFGFKDAGGSSSSGQHVSTTLITSNADQQLDKLILQSKQQLTRDFYSRTTKPSDLILVLSVSYQLVVTVDDSSILCHCHAEQNVCLSIIEPLGFEFQVYSMQVSAEQMILSEHTATRAMKTDGFCPCRHSIVNSLLSRLLDLSSTACKFYFMICF